MSIESELELESRELFISSRIEVKELELEKELNNFRSVLIVSSHPLFLKKEG